MKIGSIVNGEEKYTGEKYQLNSFNNEHLADIFHIDNEVLRWNLKNKIEFKNLYTDFTVSDVVEKFKSAGNIFLSGEIDGIGINEYTKNVSLSTGMPITVIRNSVNKLSDLFFNIEDILKFQVPYGDLSVLKNGYYNINNKTIGWIPKANNLFVMTPANHPNVNYLWIMAFALGYSIILRPSDDDPFTGYRIIKSLLKVGFPKGSLSFFPSNHSALECFIDNTNLSILFGNDTIEKKYGNISTIKTFGPGNSSIIVYEDYYKDNKNKVLNIVLKSMLESSGRGCINASHLYFVGDGRNLVEEISRSLSKIETLNPLDNKATIGAIKDLEKAKSFNKIVDKFISKGYSDVTEKYRNFHRINKLDNVPFLLPTVLYIRENGILEKDDRGIELPFPFITFMDNCSESNLLNYVSNSLSISYLSYKKDVFNKMLYCSNNGKLFFDCPTNFNNFSDPHEDYISNFLYESKALVINK